MTRPEDVRTVYKDSDQHVKAANNNAGWLMGEILGKCVGLISGTRWQALRSLVEWPFTCKNAAPTIAHIERRTKEHFNFLNVHGRLAQGLINPVDDLKTLPFWIIADIIYGKLTAEMEGELRSIIPIRESLFRRVISGKLSRFWCSQYLPSATNQELWNFQHKWVDFNEKAYHKSLAEGNDTPLVQMFRGAQHGKTSFRELYQTLDEMLFANLDVTIGALSWNLLFLGEHQGFQEVLRNEVTTERRGAPGVTTGWKEYLVSPSTLLAASIFESARLKPLAAFSVPQATRTDRTISDFVVPAGTNYIVDAYALNVRNPYWGDDSTDYRPERFLECSPIDTRYHYWRFGFGPRSCMGKYIADLMLRVILAHLVENYHLELIRDGNDWERSKETWITHPNTDVKCKRITGE